MESRLTTIITGFPSSSVARTSLGKRDDFERPCIPPVFLKNRHMLRDIDAATDRVVKIEQTLSR